METLKNQKERPGLLTTIAILSFIGLGYRIFSGLISAAMGTVTSLVAPFFRDIFEGEVDLDNVPDGIRELIEKGLDIAAKAMENASAMSLTIVLLSIVALFGVIMMWQLKKNGFYIYTAARLFILFVPVIFLGFNFFTLLSISMGIVFAVVFIVLYGINLKYME